MKKLMVLLVLAFAIPACGKKNTTPPPANPGDTATTPADPCAGKADPCAGKADPCAGKADPCAAPK